MAGSFCLRWILVAFAFFFCHVSGGLVLDSQNVTQPPLPLVPSVAEPLIEPVLAVENSSIHPLIEVPAVIHEKIDVTIKPDQSNDSILWTVADTPAPELEQPEKIVLTLEPVTSGENQLYRTIEGKLVKIVDHEAEVERPSEKCFSYLFPSKTNVSPDENVKTAPPPFGPVSSLSAPPPEMSASSFTFPRREVQVSTQQLRRVPLPPGILRYNGPGLEYPPVYRHHVVGHVDDIVRSNIPGSELETPAVKVVKNVKASSKVPIATEKREDVVLVQDKLTKSESLTNSRPVVVPPAVVTTGKSARNKGRWFWSSSYYEPYDYYYDDYEPYAPYDYGGHRPGYYWYNPYSYYKSTMK